MDDDLGTVELRHQAANMMPGVYSATKSLAMRVGAYNMMCDILLRDAIDGKIIRIENGKEFYYCVVCQNWHISGVCVAND